jgi:hypothetical protein|tara:strand:- start:17 stop:697 length:681 start_codon:yes stop_codon:yes gene_type:complete
MTTDATNEEASITDVNHDERARQLLEDRLSIELNKVKKTQSDINKLSWSAQNELTLKTWGEKAHGNHLLHDRESINWVKFSNYLHIVIITMSAVSGIISVSDTNFNGTAYLISSMTISMGALTSVVKYYKPDEKSLLHKTMSQKYSKIYRRILIELGQQRSQRSHANEFTERIKLSIDDLQAEAPLVSSSSIRYFLRNVKLDTKSFPDAVNCHTQPIEIVTSGSKE